MNIDFAALKKQVAIENVAMQMLGLKLTAAKQVSKNDAGDDVELNVLRGPCPIKHTDGARDFVITPSKQVWYSFKAKKGGDVLALVAAVKDCSVREAAELISKETGTKSEKPKITEPDKKFDVERYIQGLKSDHEALAPFGLSPETLTAWKAGYSSSGRNKGRLALPIIGTEGIMGFMGIAEDRSIIFPDNIDPRLFIFGANMIGGGKGPIYILRHPLEVLDMYQNSDELGVAFLTETISPEQMRYLIALIGEKHIELVV